MKRIQGQPCVSSIEDIKHNLVTIEQYLNDNSLEAKEKMYDLIRRGHNYVAYKVDGTYHFAPSRFIGYQDCNLDKHEENHFKNGCMTSRILRSLLGKDVENKRFEILLRRQCDKAGFFLENRHHTFWNIEGDLKHDVETVKVDSEFPEGRIREEKHKVHERNTKQIRKAKIEYVTKNGAVCQVCGFNFKEVYGNIGSDYIEAHHTIPVSEMKDGDKTKVKDMAFVCANCHRMLHRRRPWLEMKDLDKLVNRNR